MAFALYRKYRSTSLDEIVGQKHITDVLSRAIKSGRTNHAYLLTGPRGVGKTSIARILAHELNDIPYTSKMNLDIIEIDAASNNGVEDIRDLREKVAIAPVSAKKKIYIIDEVHMLSKPAFNALLKTLEEPPEHVVFILATTEVNKLPDTILSRTQRLHFRLVNKEDMTKHLASIAKKEKISIDDEALELIAERSGGSFRDAISLLDQLRNLSDSKVSPDMIESSLGLAPQQSVKLLVKSIGQKDLPKAVEILTKLEEQGIAPMTLVDQLTNLLRIDISSSPQYIYLIDELLEVGKSYDPQLKLLAIVARAASGKDTPSEKPKSVALKAHEPTISIKAPTEKKPTAETQNESEIDLHTNADIDWQSLLEDMRSESPPLYGILQKACVAAENGNIDISFGYKLHQKKLESGRYRQMLTDFLHKKLGFVPTISTSVGKLPTKDKGVSAVAAIMGGGEEINVSQK